MINNKLLYTNVQEAFPNPIERGFDEKFRIVLNEPLVNGEWIEESNKINVRTDNSIISFQKNLSKIEFNKMFFHKMPKDDTTSILITHLSDAINYNIVKEQMHNVSIDLVNPSGFGKGVVFKNFNYEEPISLN